MSTHAGFPLLKIIGDKAKVGTVVGFPHGANTTKIKIAEALEVIDNGADTLDLVINISKLKSKIMTTWKMN